MKIIRKAEKVIETTEDWYPTIDGLVRVRLTRLSDGKWRVSVWGGDDFGLERDYEYYIQAEALYNRIKNGTTQKTMMWMGMQHA